MTLFVCKSNIPLKTLCANIQTEYNLPLFVFHELDTWESGASHGGGIHFNVIKAEKLDTLMAWATEMPDNVNYQIFVNIAPDKYSIQNVKTFLGKMLLTDIIEIQAADNRIPQNNFSFYLEFYKYIEEQDKWIYHDPWSSLEHSHYAHILEESAKYEAGAIIECISMNSSDDPYKLKRQISVSHRKGKQSQEIWSGYVDSPDEYQVMMSAVNKFIEEHKKNSGAI